MIAAEYGWTITEIDQLRIDEETELIHAILYRKGAKVYLRNPLHDVPEISLEEVIRERNNAPFDTSAIEEGITWHLP